MNHTVGMNLLYTHDIFTMQRYGGVSRYFSEIIRLLADKASPATLAGLHVNDYLKDVSHVVGMKVPEVKHTRRCRRWINNAMQHSCFLLQQKAIDVVHETYFAAVGIPASLPVITTVHDMTHQLFPQHFSNSETSAKMKWSCNRAAHIIAVSENTKSDLVRIFEIDPAKVTVIHHGVSLQSNSGSSPPLAEDYILYVGARGAYKNFDRFLVAFSRSRAKRNFKLVCFGGGARTKEEIELMRRLGLEENIYFASGDDSKLAATYAAARALIYPSLYEGFGMPVLEAMALKCPVLCSRKSSLPEVAGDAASYFDPENTEDIMCHLDSNLFNDSLLMQLREKGMVRAAQFSWEKSASEHLQVYRQIAPRLAGGKFYE